MAEPVTFTLHPFYPDEGLPPLYAILPDDGSRGWVVGEPENIQALADVLGAFLSDGTHAEEISPLHEQLGWKWLTIPEAVEVALEYKGERIPETTIRAACASGHIKGAVKQGRDWRFPQARFLGWVTDRPRPGPKPQG